MAAPAPRCGAWPSAWTIESVVAGSLSLAQPRLRGGEVYWLEGRPAEGGRVVLVRAGDAAPSVSDVVAAPSVSDVVPADADVRTRVHEYGGGASLVADAGIWYSDRADGRVRAIASAPQAGAGPDLAQAGAVPLTPDSGGRLRYADFALDAPRGRLLCVREDHRVAGREPVNAIVAIALDGSGVTVLVEGSDFYSAPRPGPDGSSLAFLEWRHPQMPWESSRLWLARLDADGSVSDARCIAGGEGESVCHPCWSPTDVLHFVSDRGGWWNLYRWEGAVVPVAPVTPMDAEFGQPHWVFGQSTYGFDADGGLVCCWVRDGCSHLGRIDPAGRLQPFAVPYTDIDDLQVAGHEAVFVGGSARGAPAIVRMDLRTGRCCELRASAPPPPPGASISEARPFTFATADGQQAHAFHYPPAHPDLVPGDERPPLLVLNHGGPTSRARTSLRPAVQFWTSRGFAVVDVDYRGSTGYGRAYRELLDGRWGVADVDDAVHAVRHLAARGDCDPLRVAIRGGSAGGYTALAAMTFRDGFAAGASYYGIADLELLAQETHKFESRYLERLVGPHPARADLYRERSPLHAIDRIRGAIILFQGLDDKAVPPNQAERMYEAIRSAGKPVAYLAFEGEGHGFRRAETLVRCLQAELAFYGRIFHFTPADPLPPIPIDNLPH